MLELREMREEIISLREELRGVKTKLREEEGEERKQYDRDDDMEDFAGAEAEQESLKKAIRSHKRESHPLIVFLFVLSLRSNTHYTLRSRQRSRKMGGGPII